MEPGKLIRVTNALYLNRCVGHMYTFVKTHQTVLPKCVHFTVCKLYLLKIIIREKQGHKMVVYIKLVLKRWNVLILSEQHRH